MEYYLQILRAIYYFITLALFSKVVVVNLKINLKYFGPKKNSKH